MDWELIISILIDCILISGTALTKSAINSGASVRSSKKSSDSISSTEGDDWQTVRGKKEGSNKQRTTELAEGKTSSSLQVSWTSSSDNTATNNKCASCTTSLLKAENLYENGKIVPAMNSLCEVICKDHVSHDHSVIVQSALKWAMKIFCDTLRRKGEWWIYTLKSLFY